MPLVCGVDSSTQSTKVEIRDAETGRLVSSGHAPHPVVTPPVAEADPTVWWDAFQFAFAAAGSPEVAAISVGGQQHGAVVLDAGFQPIRPAKLWNDTTTAPDADWLRSRLRGGDAGWAQATGSVPLASFTISKLSWLHRNEGDSWARLAHVCLPHDYLTYRLSGELVTDRGDASGTGYWSPADERYRYDLLELVDDGLDWSSMLPAVHGPIDAAGEWLGGPAGTLVGPGTGDNMAAALGLGAEPGDVVISLGTSGTVSTVSERPTADPSGAVAGFADATGRFLPLVCTLNATKVTGAIGRLFGLDFDQLDAEALATPAGAGGVTLLPYFDGERTPNRPTATGSLAGLRSDVSRGQVVRAAFEGVVCGLLDGLDALAEHAPVDGRLLLTGGGAGSVGYRQILADLSGRPVVVPGSSQAVALGAAAQAAAVLARRPPEEVVAAWSLAPTTTVPPNEVDRDDIRHRYERVRDQ
jgi:xylulokinase